MKLYLLTYLSVLMWSSPAKSLEKCEFAKIAKENGLTNIGTWTCIAYQESHLNYKAKNGGYYGIFQISSEDWCGPGKKCGIPCESLLNSDLSDDIRCAKKIYNAALRRSKKNGFSPWSSSRYCQKNQALWISTCKI